MTVVLRLVWVPAVVTLLVTLLRLLGEVMGWSPRWFSTAAGGGQALVGIIWLVPLFGLWFGRQLARGGARPPRIGRALLLQVAAVLVYVGGFQAVIRVLAFDTATPGGLVAQLLSMGAVSAAAAAVAAAGWPRLAAVELVYGLLARLPVAAITYVAVLADLGTHFEKLGPTDYAGFAPLVRASWLAYAQVVFWTGFTVACGGLFGTIAAAATRPGPGSSRPSGPNQPS